MVRKFRHKNKIVCGFYVNYIISAPSMSTFDRCILAWMGDYAFDLLIFFVSNVSRVFGPVGI